MKVIVASQRTQGTRETDFAWTLDGELVHLPALECDRDDGTCGCDRALCGVASARATTTAEVADRELEAAEVFTTVARSLVDGGWFETLNGEAFEIAADMVAPLLIQAAVLPVGTVIERHGDRLMIRERAGERTG